MRRAAWRVAGAVLAASVAAASPADAQVHPEWGHTGAHDKVLRSGCHVYHYHYVVHPPPGDWALETFIIGPSPQRRHLAEGAFAGNFDPTRGRGKFTLCIPTATTGRYTIRAKLSVQNGPSSYVQGWLPKSHFRVRAPHH